MTSGAAQLQDWLERRGVNRAEGAEIIDIDATQFSHILNGKRRPGLDTAVKIERKTGIPVEAWVPFSNDNLDDTGGPVAEKAGIDKV